MTQQTSNEPPIDIGISKGEVKSQHLNQHYFFVNTIMGLVADNSQKLSAARVRQLVELHATAIILDLEKHIAFVEMLNEKIDAYKNEIAATRRKSVDQLTTEELDFATIRGCLLAEGFITHYVDQYLGVEERFEVGVV